MPSIDLSLLDICAFVDPSGSKSAVKRVGARSAIAVVGRDPAEHDFLLEAWAARTSTDRLIERIFDTNQRWRPRAFGVEANAMQSLFADALRREARFSQVRIPFVDVYQPTHTEKPFRNRSALQPIIAAGRFFMLDDQIEARNELATHPMSPTFDIVDSITSAISLLRKRPQQTLAKQEEVDLMRYLRRSGASEATIRHYQSKLRGDLPDTPPRNS